MNILRFRDRTEVTTLDFVTNSKAHKNKAPGVGVFEDKIPATIDGFSVDGESVEFFNGDTIVAIKNALDQMQAFRKKRIVIDGFGFTAMYKGVVDLGAIPDGTERWMKFDIGESVEPEEVADGDILGISSQYHDKNAFLRHAVIATDSDVGMMCFHVLGSNGPIALSGLNEAMYTFSGNVLNRIEDIAPLY